MVELESGVLFYAIAFVIYFVLFLRDKSIMKVVMHSFVFIYVCLLIEVTILPIPITAEMIAYNFSKNQIGAVNLTDIALFSGFQANKLLVRHYILNILMTVPLGIILGYFIKKNKLVRVILVTTIISCSIEIIQWIMQITMGTSRDVDINDVIFNIAGGVVGYLILKISNRIWRNYHESKKNI